ncbi:MAG: TonB-dependent receptor [Gemmatimonadetes bacterium]|nr:TonB-dependent receptor [Gemmatimonadota bacterium]
MFWILVVPAAAVLAAFFHPPRVLAQDVYGSIEGAARSGTVIRLAGTALASEADSTNRYRVEDVPAGAYQLEINDGGTRVEGSIVHVIAGERQTVDVVFSAAEGPRATSVPPADVRARGSGSSFSLAGELFEKLPALDDPRQALALSPGAVLRRGDAGIDDLPTISLRGSLGPPSVYVDGAPATLQTLGGQGLALGTNALAEASVTTGISPASVRDAAGGTIGYVTRLGGPRLEGMFRAQSDGLTGNASRAGYTSFEARVGGPAPIRHLIWSLSGTLRGQQSPYRGPGAEGQPTYIVDGVDTTFGAPYDVALPRFVQWSGRCGETGNTASSNGEAIRDNYGFDCHGARRPMDWANASRGHAKVAYSYGRGSTVSLTGLLSTTQQRFFPGSNIVDSALYSGRRVWSRLGVLNWRQRLPQLGSGYLRLTANLSVGVDRVLEGALDSASERITCDPALPMEFHPLTFLGMDSIPFPLTDQIIQNVRTNTGLRVPYLDRGVRNGQFGRLNPFGMATLWPTVGMDVPLTMIAERRLNGRWDLAWNSPTVRLVSGIEVAHTTASYYDAPSILRETFFDLFLVHPKQYALYAAARFEGPALTVDAGIRLDWFNSDALFPKTPGRIFTNPLYTNTNPLIVYKAAIGHSAISPRFRLGYRPMPGAEFRVGFGRAAAMPSYEVLFSGTNADLSFTSPFGQIFSQDVPYAASQWWEFGFRGLIGRLLTVDLAGYGKDRVGTYDPRLVNVFDPKDQRPLSILSLGPNRTHANGLDAGVTWRGGQGIRVLASYSYVRRAQGGDSLTPVGASAPPGEVQQAFSVFAVAATPPARGGFPGWIARDVRLAVIARAVSGLPYTRLKNVGLGVLAPGELEVGARVEPINSSRLPWTRTVDVKLGKSLHDGRFSATLYVDARNLFGFTNTHALYAETGTVENDLYRNSFVLPERNNLKNVAISEGKLAPDGATVDVRDCTAWSDKLNCVALSRVENRFGDGDGLYSGPEQDRALNAFFDSLLGAWRLRGPGRIVRIGAEFHF